MNKRDAVLGLLEGDGRPGYVPAGFFIHFDQAYHRGQAAVDKHLEYFHYTGMDFVKIQYEDSFPHRPQIQTAEDWAKMPLYGQEYYQNQLDILAGLLKAAQKEAPVIMTLYSPFMCAGSTVGRQLLVEHIKEDPDKVKKGMEIITESLMIFVRECIKLGIDGFYTSTQGGETYRFGGSPLFDACVKPYDLALMEEIDRSCIFNVLHICDYHGGYDDLTPFLDYPGHVVNCNQRVGSEMLSGKQLSQMFNRPFMGGMDRHGIIVSGSRQEISQRVVELLDEAPQGYILAADCTLPGDVNWDNIKTAITTAHNGR